MKIKQMTASFGKLTNETISFGDGLTVVYAPNEGGKSTWVAFLRAMLYGIPTKERDKQGYVAEKNRYQPWNGAPMEGSMELTWGGRDIILRRGPKGGIPFGFFEAVYADSGAHVPNLTADTCGEVLLGIPREVYERTAYVSQGGSKIDSAPALEGRIAALVSSGEEEVSHSTVEKRLKEWLNRRRHNKTGLIPTLEDALSQDVEALTQQGDTLQQRSQWRMAVELLDQRSERLGNALEVAQTQLDSTYYAQCETRRSACAQQYGTAIQELSSAQEELHTAQTAKAILPEKEVLEQAQGDLNFLNTLKQQTKLAAQHLEDAKDQWESVKSTIFDPRFPNMTPDESWEKANEDADTWRNLRPPTTQRVLGVIFVLLGLGAVAAGFLTTLGTVLYGVGGALVMGGIIALVQAKRTVDKQQATRQRLMEHYRVIAPLDILPLATAYRERYTTVMESERSYQQAVAQVTQLSDQQKEITEGVFALVKTFEPTVSTLFGVSAALSRGLGWDERCERALLKVESAQRIVDSLTTPEQLEASLAGQHPTPTEDMVALTAQIKAIEGERGRYVEELARAEGKLDSLGNPDAIQLHCQTLQDTLAQRQSEYAALTLALEGLAQANEELQARFSPIINARAGELMSALTDGKYYRAALPRDFEPTASQEGSILPRRALLLSQGTADQLYLAVRLAVCQEILPTTEPVPVVLDDALTAFDDERVALALTLLVDLARNQQMILFTCHTREGTWAQNRQDVAYFPLQLA